MIANEPVGVTVVEIRGRGIENLLDEASCLRLAAEVSASSGPVVITGNGHTFCQGLSGSVETSEESVRNVIRLLSRAATERPVVAALDGDAIGSGLAIALSCRQICCWDGASVGTSIVSGVASTSVANLAPLLAKRVGYQRAAELLLRGRVVGAEEAMGMGLVTTTCDTRTGTLRKAIRLARSESERGPTR